MITTEHAAIWFDWRAKSTPMPAARKMFEMAAAALREKAEREQLKPQTTYASECQQKEK